jgi:hypothetical protein
MNPVPLEHAAAAAALRSSCERTAADSGDAAWRTVPACPACGSSERLSRGTIPERAYVFGAAAVATPAAGITVHECRACGLAYKSPVPSPDLLAALFRRYAAVKWLPQADMAAEAAALARIAGSAAFDLLDVGAANGALLAARAAGGPAGRRSALDVMRYPGLDAHLAGEFIEGFLDAPAVEWSGRPYRVVTLFDVLEHLYDPGAAFGNLRALVAPGGFAVIESGDARSFWPQRFGLGEWWYLRLIEHHIAWSRRPVERIARAHGFEIVSWEACRHKSRRDIGLAALGNDLLETGLYWVAGKSYRTLARLFGKQGNQPWYPLARDHFRTILRRL